MSLRDAMASRHKNHRAHNRDPLSYVHSPLLFECVLGEEYGEDNSQRIYGRPNDRT